MAGERLSTEEVSQRIRTWFAQNTDGDIRLAKIATDMNLSRQVVWLHISEVIKLAGERKILSRIKSSHVSRRETTDSKVHPYLSGDLTQQQIADELAQQGNPVSKDKVSRSMRRQGVLRRRGGWKRKSN